MSFPRSAGILLHPTSLASSGGVGDFGSAAYQFVDFLAAARQGLWQVLPLGPLGYGNSPYSSTSAFAGNPLLISLERLASHGWIDQDKIPHLATESGPVAYGQVFATKKPVEALWLQHRPEHVNALNAFVGRMRGGWMILFCSMRCARDENWQAGMNGHRNWRVAKRVR
jgi:4-alpha-glucanotransferase